jgi:tetratricopeptide (TPR) repeat protein
MKGDFLFEVAYSFSEKGDLNSAKENYESYQKKMGVTNASLNNLGLIYRDQNKLYNAQELFKEALSLNKDDETALRNYENVTKMIAEQEREAEELLKAALTFNLENAWIKGKLISFSKQRNREGLIVCPYRQLPQFLGVTEIKASELIKTFLDKKYVIKVTNHNINTNSSVYRINTKIVDFLEDLLAKNKRENELISIAENINIDQYSNLGLDEKLLNYLDKISSPELKSMLERDMNENVIALITKSYKMALLMSGSIVEAVLLDHIVSKSITSYTLENGKAKKVNQMDLNELLYVANKEGYIEVQLYHFAHGIRGFRNLIHPGVEKRKATIVVNEENALLAWGIVKKVIQEI